MSKRLWCGAHAAMALLVGGGVYLILREGTVMHDVLAFLSFSPSALSQKAFWGGDFCRYYLPDALWAYSLQFALCGGMFPQKCGTAVMVAVTTVCGAGFEMLQQYGILRGTADIVDVLLYFCGGFLAAAVYVKFILGGGKRG